MRRRTRNAGSVRVAPGKSCPVAQQVVNRDAPILPGMEQPGVQPGAVAIDPAQALQALVQELPRRRWSGKRIVLTVLAAAFVASAAAALWVYADRRSSGAQAPVFVQVPEMTVNMRSIDGSARYLKVRLAIEAQSREEARAIEGRLPLVIDGFQSFLRELRPEDLAGASGTYRIKEELLIRVNTAVALVRARDVLVQELIQQ